MAVKLVAGCVIRNEDNNVLLIHRNTAARVQWELPGGKVEPIESPAAAAMREVHEELGLRVSLVREIGSTTFREDGITWEYHWFSAVIVKGIPFVRENDKHDAIAYADLLDPELPCRRISINLKKLISQLKNNKITL